jgi:ribosomal protein L37E
LWEKANLGKHRAQITRRSRRNGHRPYNENKECSSFLGIHVAERVLSHVFKDVKRMPLNNPGYDVICNHNKLIDIKSACQMKDGRWQFHISNNVIADFFLCLAFDNREDLNPLYAWLIPGSVINHLMGVSISQSTIHKWDEHRLDTSKIYECCDAMRAEA